MAEQLNARTRFVPVALVGVLSAALTSVASSKPWFAAAIDYKLMPGVSDPDKSADMPLALALSLVVLAGWGAVLVSRGKVRRAVVAVALVAGVGVLGCLVAAPFTLPDDIRDRLLPGSDDVTVNPTGWFLAAAVAGVVSVVTLAVAWVQLPRWPTMSSRYDAPVGQQHTEIRTDTDLWKALDEGHDPTASDERRSP